MRETPLITSLLFVVVSCGGFLLPAPTCEAQVAKSVSDSFPELTIARREVFTDVRRLRLFLPPPATPPVAVTAPTVVFSHRDSAGNLVTRRFDELRLDPATRALILATPLPAGGYNLPTLSTIRPVRFLDVEVIAADPAGLTFRHRDGLARVAFEELSQELQIRYSFRNAPDQSLKIDRLGTSRAETETFLDVRIIGSDNAATPTTVRFTHRDSNGTAVVRPLADLDLSPAERALVLSNLNPPPTVPAVPAPVTFFRTLGVRRSEFREVEVVRVEPGALVFRHADSGGKEVRRRLEELALGDSELRRFDFKRDRDTLFKEPNLRTTRKEEFLDVTITGIDLTATDVPATNLPNRIVTFRHGESGGETISRRFGDLDPATRAAITAAIAAFPIPAPIPPPPGVPPSPPGAVRLPGAGVVPPTPVFVEIFLPRVTTVLNEEFENIEVERIGVNGVTFRHRLSGGVAMTRALELLPDEARARFGYKAAIQGDRRPTLRLDRLTTPLGREFEDVVILAAEANGLVFRHRGGTTKLPFSELPDRIREKYDFKDDNGQIFGASTLRSNRGEEFNDVVILSSDPLGLTFRHRDGTTKLDFVDLPDEVRKKFNYNLDDALDFRRAHTPVRRPAPSRRRFLVNTNGHVPAIGRGRFTPATGFRGTPPAIGARRIGVVPGFGARGAVPAVGAGIAVPAAGISGGAPSIGVGGAPPAIGVGK